LAKAEAAAEAAEISAVLAATSASGGEDAKAVPAPRKRTTGNSR